MRHSLANTFEQLSDEHEQHARLTQYNFEDLDLDDVLDIALESFEEKSHRLDLLDAALEDFESQDPEAPFDFESLDEDLHDLFTDTALESLGLESMDSLSMEAKVGGITGLFQRMWQVYFLEFLTDFDFLTDLVKSSSKRVGKYRQRLEDTRIKFDKKKPKLDQKNQKASYANLHNYWMTESGFVKDPFKQLDIEENLAKYLMFTYPEIIEKEMTNLAQIAKKAKVDSAEDFKSSVIEPLEKRKHPVSLFDSGLLGGRPYMAHTGFRITGKKSDKSGLVALSAKRKVAMTKRLLIATETALIPTIIPDVQLSNDEIEAMLDRGDDFLTLTESFLKETDQMRRSIGALKGGLEVMIKDAKKSGNEGLKTDIKHVGRYAKVLIDCYWSPSVRTSKRNIELVKAMAYLTNRLVAHAK